MSRATTGNAADSLRALYSSGDGSRRDGEAAAIGSLRDEAWTSFEAQGIPARRLEAWKGTNLAPLEAMQFERVGPGQARSDLALTATGPELVFVDGRFAPECSRIDDLPSGCRLLSLAEARREAPELLHGRLGRLADPKRGALVALQTAFLDDGAVLVIDRGVSIAEPICLRFLSSGTSGAAPTASFPRLLVVAGENSETTLYQEHDSLDESAGFTAFVGELYLAAGAHVEAVQIQNESAARIHFSHVHARLERNARFDSHVFTLAKGLTRSELEIELAEPGCETRMRGFFLGHDSSHVDHFTTVDHAADHCTSDQEYRGVLADRSRGVFRGRVIVRPDAQKTDARQSNPNLLISDHASVDAKPQLEIYADDVRASHGSTIGQLDPDALFFLQARGIGVADARLLLTRAFAHAIVDGIGEDGIRARVAQRVDATLAELEGKARKPGSNGATRTSETRPSQERSST